MEETRRKVVCSILIRDLSVTFTLMQSRGRVQGNGVKQINTNGVNNNNGIEILGRDEADTCVKD